MTINTDGIKDLITKQQKVYVNTIIKARTPMLGNIYVTRVNGEYVNVTYKDNTVFLETIEENVTCDSKPIYVTDSKMELLMSELYGDIEDTTNVIKIFDKQGNIHIETPIYKLEDGTLLTILIDESYVNLYNLWLNGKKSGGYVKDRLPKKIGKEWVEWLERHDINNLDKTELLECSAFGYRSDVRKLKSPMYKKVLAYRIEPRKFDQHYLLRECIGVLKLNTQGKIAYKKKKYNVYFHTKEYNDDTLTLITG